MQDQTLIGKDKTVLLVDDDPFILNAYSSGLSRYGFSVYEAKDGQDAMDLLKDYIYDIVVLDLVMPKLSGFEVLKKLKKDVQLRKTPVVVLTNLNQDSDRQEVLGLGASDFLIKSETSLNDLVNAIIKTYH